MLDVNLFLTIVGIILTIIFGTIGILLTRKYGKKQIGSSFKGSSFKKSLPNIDKKLNQYTLSLVVGRGNPNNSNLHDGENFNVNIWTIKISNKSLRSKILRSLRILYNCQVKIHIENFHTVIDFYFKPKDVNLPTRYISGAGLNNIPVEELRSEYERRIGFEYIHHLLQIAKDHLIIEKGKDAEILFLLTLENSNNAFLIHQGQIGWISGILAHKQDEQFLILPIANERKINIYINYSYKEKGHDIYRSIEKSYKLKINSWEEIILE